MPLIWITLSIVNARKDKKETTYIRDSSGTVIEEYETKRISPLLPDTRITNIYIAGILRIHKKHKGVVKERVQQIISTNKYRVYHKGRAWLSISPCR